MGWTAGFEAAGAVVVLLLLLPVLWLFVRRRWLSSRGGVFDCALRIRSGHAGSGWALGLARYNADSLEWYRIFSFAVRPRLVLRQRSTSLVGRRAPDTVEQIVLFEGHVVVQVRDGDASGEPVRELGMSVENATALAAWLEAAPPRGADVQRTTF